MMQALGCVHAKLSHSLDCMGCYQVRMVKGKKPARCICVASQAHLGLRHLDHLVAKLQNCDNKTHNL
jgi:hypothetical protein